MREGGIFDRGNVARLIERAARDIDSLTLVIDQYREEYEQATERATPKPAGADDDRQCSRDSDGNLSCRPWLPCAQPEGCVLG